MKKFQVVGIGNAMVDVLSHAEDAFLDANGIGKGIIPHSPSKSLISLS